MFTRFEFESTIRPVRLEVLHGWVFYQLDDYAGIRVVFLNHGTQWALGAECGRPKCRDTFDMPYHGHIQKGKCSCRFIDDSTTRKRI
jgi:hypothetical protein